MLFHCKPVNQQKTSIFALILWEEQRLNRFWSEKRCWNSTFTFGPPKSVLSSIWAQLSYYLWRIHVEDPEDLTIAHAWPEVTSPEVTWLFSRIFPYLFSRTFPPVLLSRILFFLLTYFPVFFPLLFSPVFFFSILFSPVLFFPRIFFPVHFSLVLFFSRCFFFSYFFSRTFFQYFFLSSSTKNLVGGVLYDVRVL